jgi:hypothetical protein
MIPLDPSNIICHAAINLQFFPRHPDKKQYSSCRSVFRTQAHRAGRPGTHDSLFTPDSNAAHVLRISLLRPLDDPEFA